MSDQVEEDLHRYVAPVVGPDDERVFTDSGIEIDRLYDESDVAPDLEERLGEPGAYPFTRGIHEGMYRDRLWTMRQYAGFASPEDTNERYRYLIEHGSTGLSMAFDLPTQLGRDSDDPLCDGEVGRTGVPIDTIEDMRICFDQIPLDQVSTSMTINAPAAILLLLYELVGEEQGVPSEKLRGTVQNDVLKEYVARGNYIYPPEPTMRLTTDIFEYCAEHVPKWNTISISGYHIREKGCSAVQEVAFTLANAIAYVEAALARGLEIDEFAPAARLLLQLPQQRLPGDRQVPRGAADVGEDRARPLRLGVRALADDPLPHPDRRRHPAGPAARGQHHPRRPAGLRGGLRRHPVAAHQRLRRGAGAADRALGADRAAHPAGDRPRVRRRRHRRPLRRLLLRRVAHRRDREALLGADGQGRASSAARSTRSSSSSARSRSRRSPTTSATAPARTSSSASTSTSPTRSTTSTSSGSTPSPSGASSSGWRSSRPTAIGLRSTRRLEEPARGRPRRRQPAAPDPRRACRKRLDRRGLRRHARRLRRVQGRGVLLDQRLPFDRTPR